MSIQELQREIESASSEERLYLQALLLHLSRRDGEAYRHRLAQRVEEIAGGHKVDIDQIKRLHELLEAQGTARHRD